MKLPVNFAHDDGKTFTPWQVVGIAAAAAVLSVFAYICLVTAMVY